MQPFLTAFFVYDNIYLENKKLNTYCNMNKKLIRLTESDLHKIVKESVNKIVNETHVIDKQFGMGGNAGSFENALVDAWKLASPNNRKKLENAFPDYFPSEAMYGNDEEPFDFREFPHRGAYDEFYKGWQQRHSK